MGKASLTIAISGEYNSRAVDRARESLRRLNIEGASTAGGITEGLAKFGGAVGEFGGKVYGAGKKMESVGDAATRSITVPIAGAAAACGMAAIDIDTALTGVRKTVDGTEEQYREKFTHEDLFNEFTRDENGNAVRSREEGEKKI